jgi:uncharacterized protein (TIGR02145 family)
MNQRVNSVIDRFLLAIIFCTLLLSCKKEGDIGKDIVKDVDGNVYHTVTIGTQVWMKENLRTTKYNDGTPISNVVDIAWTILPSAAYCWYLNDVGKYRKTYGALYNWYTVASDNPKNVCPSGWHVPSDTEWGTLTAYLGDETVAGDKLKESGNTHWTEYNTSATNETSFTALPGGWRINDGQFSDVGWAGYWWSSTGYPDYALGRELSCSYSYVIRLTSFKVTGMSVRCVMD